MKILHIAMKTVPISRFADPAIPSGGLTTTLVAIATDVVRSGRSVVGYGFSSIGRFGQEGLIKERFAPRLMDASFADIADESERNIDPLKAWNVMMRGEKPGGHGERCVAVGTLDMALWDLAAKIADVPLYGFISSHGPKSAVKQVRAYAGGGYYYPEHDIRRLTDEAERVRDLGYTRFKLKIGGVPILEDLKRIDAVAKIMGGFENVAVDAMNSYTRATALEAAAALAPLGLWWFEDVCDPLDFDALASVVRRYDRPVAAGEALFSVAEAKLLEAYGGIRKDKDILLFDPVHCYGLPGYLEIVKEYERRGWGRASFWPHGGHLFTLHLVQGLGLGGSELNPLCFQPFGGLTERSTVCDGWVCAPDLPGVGFEGRDTTKQAFCNLLH